jgi:ribosomal protein S20
MSYSKKPPKGLVTERTLRSMIRTIAKKLKTELSVEESLALLKQQERLAKQLAKVDAANAAQET